MLDQQAVLGGAVGGGLGVNLFDVLAVRFAPSTRENAATAAGAGRSKITTCQFAGQAYSAGAHVAMPDERGRKGFRSNRRICNQTLMSLGWTPSYPSYREGLLSISNEMKIHS